MAATTYTTQRTITLAGLERAYESIGLLFFHLARMHAQSGVSLVVQTMVINANRMVITLNNPIPGGAAQLAHLEIT